MLMKFWMAGLLTETTRVTVPIDAVVDLLMANCKVVEGYRRAGIPHIGVSMGAMGDVWAKTADTLREQLTAKLKAIYPDGRENSPDTTHA
jgi:hypothetical protein